MFLLLCYILLPNEPIPSIIGKQTDTTRQK